MNETTAIVLLRRQLKEAIGLIVDHHEAGFANFRGSCPKCDKRGHYPHSIFMRAEDLLKQTKQFENRRAA